MENKRKLNLAITIACVAAVSIFLTSKYWRKRKQKQSLDSCYLRTETKSQNTFKRVLTDNSYSPFKHLKLNDSDNENGLNSHPYEEEITALLENPRHEFSFVSGNVDLKLSESYVWIDSEDRLQELVDVLRKVSVFGVDTEQHSLRSFLGFTALIQISTEEEDYLVDTIALHDVMGILRPAFADPLICKVFHGADNDVLWLQRDFHIYIVNLFDTAKACEVLSKPQKSLAYLLEIYCGVTTNKLLQREDWRQRPLSEEMVQYARTDARYLLYIADCLITELKQQDTGNKIDASEDPSHLNDNINFYLEASRRSNTICLQLYSKDIEDSPGRSSALSICSRNLIGQGGVALKSSEMFQDLVRQLCAWRDLMARVHDESLRYVLSDHAIVALACNIPTTQEEIYDAISQADLNVDSMSFNSFLPSPSSVVCSHLEDFYHLFRDDIDKTEDVLLMILKSRVGANGSCPLSIYNYSLLAKFNTKIKSGSVSKRVGQNSKRIGRKASRALFVQKFSCKSPVYHNCRIYASDGRLLCYCDRRKLEWYLRRDLAKLVEDNPPAIMLLFEPKGRPEDEGNDFYIQSKKNICVGCGERNHYLRYRIIPSCYRIHFPEHLKSHRSHDIVLVCVDCHEAAHSAAEKYKKRIAAEFGIPLFIQKVVDDSKQTQVISGSSVSVVKLEEAGVSPLQLRTAAMALLRHGPRMPSERCEELRKIVMTYYGGREISEQDLERALLVGMSPHERRRLEKKKGLSLKHSTGSFSNKEANVSLDNNEETCDVEVNGEISTIIDGDTNSDKDAVSETVESRYMKCDESGPSKHSSKLSLLGHGPHGKQVVDHLLKKYGEDGVRQFCQRWRQVFVEAINPRFLPAGWDVMHRI